LNSSLLKRPFPANAGWCDFFIQLSEYFLNDRRVLNAGDRFVGTASGVSILR
jgi:hypothetical protein